MGIMTKRVEIPAYSTPRTITAAAQRIKLSDRAAIEELRVRSSNLVWQREAWIYYDAIGEIKYAFGLVAAVMSRLRLYAAAVVDPDSPPVRVSDAAVIDRPEGEDDPTKTHKGIDPRLARDAHDVLSKMLSRSSVPGMLRAFALNISTPGECYVLLRDNEWQVKSTDEVKVGVDGRMTVQTSASGRPIPLDEDTTIGRVWRQHPRYSSDPDSSMRALLTDCEELLLLGRMIRSSSRSRLNAGILYVPDEVSVSRRTVTDDEIIEEGEEAIFEEELLQSIMAPVNDENAANSVVPLLLRGPAELKDAIKYIEISRVVDPQLVSRADRTLERILQGIDVPKDIVTGLANIKYSNAVQIDESLYKAHVEPQALMFVDALTDIMLRPSLMAKGWSYEDVSKVVVWYDPSEVVTRPDQAESAQEGWVNYTLSASAWRQAHGFSDSDAPGEEEIAARLAVEKTTIPPEIATALLNHLLPGVLEAAAESARVEGEMPSDLRSMLDGTEESPLMPVGEASA